MKPQFCVILAFGVFLFFVSCEQPENVISGATPTGTPPIVPPSATYDLNDDGIDDIKLNYWMVILDGVGFSGSGYSGMFDPLNNNQLYFKRDEDLHALTLFNQLKDTIRSETKKPTEWTYSNAELVYIYNVPKNHWPDEWTINSSLKNGPFYLGVRLENDVVSVGWLKLDIDKSTGSVFLLDQEFTTGDYIVINR